VQSQPEKLAYGADKANVPDAIAQVKSGDFAEIHVDMIARAGATEAIPSLKQQFVHTDDPLLKAKIAAAIVRLGNKDDTYWDFLVKLATPALESDAPDFMGYDSQGKAVSGPSPEFVAWADAHNLPHGGLLEQSRYLLPGTVGFLGWSRDPRAIPLLRQALLSRNHMIEIMAAMGLAEIGDKDSIPLIVDACRKAPADAAAIIAESLVYFDDTSAQSAVDQFIPKDIAKIYRDAKAHGNTKPMSPPLYNKLPNL
jgi:HEAT repeat protein